MCVCAYMPVSTVCPLCVPLKWHLGRSEFLFKKFAQHCGHIQASACHRQMQAIHSHSYKCS